LLFDRNICNGVWFLFEAGFGAMMERIAPYDFFDSLFFRVCYLIGIFAMGLGFLLKAGFGAMMERRALRFLR
jgi:hypothetical protein